MYQETLNWLLGQGYAKDAELNLLLSPGTSFSYSDGDDAERRILAAVQGASDRSVFSSELAGCITDWPSEYHLSRQRHCLVRPLDIRSDHKVLELGCGCGAVTRYLGELGGLVVAVEGSAVRARIAAERCRDLPNVIVVADDLLSARLPPHRFDWALMVGVLEYATVYVRDGDPVGDYLRRAQQALADDGRVAVAIENKLGLKYFAGLGEDHVNLPDYGLQGLYRPGEPTTFGRQELTQHMTRCGFAAVDFWYPFPDYKLPRVILSEAGLAEPAFRSSEMLATAYARDYPGAGRPRFNEPLVYRQLARNGLLGELSNSFLAVASPRGSVARNDLLGASYAVQRQPALATETRFVRNGTAIEVTKARLCPDAGGGDLRVGQLVITQIGGRERYLPGRLAGWRVIEQRARKGTVADVADAYTDWFAYLLDRAFTRPNGIQPRRLDDLWVDGDLLDCTPFNLVETQHGLEPIDQEWRAGDDLPLGWLVIRSVYASLIMQSFGVEDSAIPCLDVVRALCARRGIEVEERSVAEWLGIEAQFQSAVAATRSEPWRVDALASTRQIAPAAFQHASQPPSGSSRGEAGALGWLQRLHARRGP